jgi:hypothetical protein
MMIACRCVGPTHTVMWPLWVQPCESAVLKSVRASRFAGSRTHDDSMPNLDVANRTMAQFCTHDLTKGLSYVSTQNQANSTHFFSILLVSIVTWPDCRRICRANLLRMQFQALFKGVSMVEVGSAFRKSSFGEQSYLK